MIRSAFFDGASYPELAEREGVPLPTMKRWIRRGLLRLRGCLEQSPTIANRMTLRRWPPNRRCGCSAPMSGARRSPAKRRTRNLRPRSPAGAAVFAPFRDDDERRCTARRTVERDRGGNHRQRARQRQSRRPPDPAENLAFGNGCNDGDQAPGLAAEFLSISRIRRRRPEHRRRSAHRPLRWLQCLAARTAMEDVSRAGIPPRGSLCL